jgi:hypothetical protein
MTVSYELMKWGFGWYVTSVADFGSAYGNLTTVVVLLFWIYLCVGSVCPQRRNRPSLHHAKSTKGADSNCLRGLGVMLEAC